MLKSKYKLGFSYLRVENRNIFSMELYVWYSSLSLKSSVARSKFSKIESNCILSPLPKKKVDNLVR